MHDRGHDVRRGEYMLNTDIGDSVTVSAQVFDHGDSLVARGSYLNKIVNHEINPLTAKIVDFNFHSLEVVPRWRDSQI